MLARLEIQLKSEQEINYGMSTLFHGALMELLPEEHAEELHRSQLHPYTQHLELRGGTWYWIITCMNQAATQRILKEVLWNVSEIELKKKEQTITFAGKTYAERPHQELMNDFYELRGERYLQIQFLTPTAFKQRGQYLFYPDLRCLYQSLMNKYDAAVAGEIMADEDTLEQLCENSQISRYDLKSTYFYLEGTRVSAFIGKITIRMNGTRTMSSLAKMLFEFGEYSGVGIKAALGMGAIKLVKEGESRRDRTTG